MPHIVIKTIAGPDDEQIKAAAKRIVRAVCEEMGKPEKYISVSCEKYDYSDWSGVYDEYVRDRDNVVIKPGYTDPVTFR